MSSSARALLFVGVGKMGLPMARHLHAAGHAVTAFDPSPERRALAAAQGLAVVATAWSERGSSMGVTATANAVSTSASGLMNGTRLNAPLVISLNVAPVAIDSRCAS